MLKPSGWMLTPWGKTPTPRGVMGTAQGATPTPVKPNWTAAIVSVRTAAPFAKNIGAEMDVLGMSLLMTKSVMSPSCSLFRPAACAN